MSRFTKAALPATEPQKEYARRLRIAFSESITRAEISKLIDDAQMTRVEHLEELQRGEGEAWDKFRAEVLAAIDADPDDCRLSRAEASQMVEALNRKELAAVLITVPLVDFDPEDLTGAQFTTCFSDGMTREQMESIIASAAMTNWKRKGIDLVAQMNKASDQMTEASRLMEQVSQHQKEAKGH